MRNINFALLLTVLTGLTYPFSVRTNKKITTASSKKWICSGGADPSTLTKREILRKFVESPCSPAILLSGIGGTNLVVDIDCEELRAQDPQTFETCGWNACSSKDRINRWQKRNIPKKEYQIWIPDVNSPMSIFSPFQRNKDCFASLFGPDYDFIDNKLKLKRKRGLTIYPLGLSSTSKGYKKNLCGSLSLIDFLNGLPNPQIIQYYHKVHLMLENMGYVSGLTLQAFPYDFRLDASNDENQKHLLPVIRRLKELNNKKVTILAHSLGNVRVASMLWDTPQEEKDELIENFLSLAPPFLGSPDAMLNLICGNPTLEYPFGFGIHMKSFRKTVGSFTGLTQLLPSEVFTSDRKRPQWVSEMEKLTEDYKSGKIEEEKYGLPLKSDKEKFELRISQLKNLGKVTGGKMDNLTVQQVLQRSGVSEVADKLYSVYDKRFSELKPLGVPVVLVFATQIPTSTQFHFLKTLEEAKKRTNLCKPSQDYTAVTRDGDGSVPAGTVQAAGLKWMTDYLNGVNGAKPVKIFEIGSEANISDVPFDLDFGSDLLGEKKRIKKNGFFGLKSRCDKKKYLGECDHIGMLFAPGVLDLIQNTLLVGERTELSKVAQEMDEKELEQYLERCEILTKGLNKDGLAISGLEEEKREACSS